MENLDDLVAAVVRKLPAPGADFPGEKREAWLAIMAMALDVAYGAADKVLQFPPLSIAARADRHAGRPYGEEFTVGPALAEGKLVMPAAASLPAPAPAKPLPRFLIDLDGIAKANTGERLMPSDVMGPIYDLRGELGDLSAIVWADDSRGVRGLHLDISTAA